MLEECNFFEIRVNFLRVDLFITLFVNLDPECIDSSENSRLLFIFLFMSYLKWHIKTSHLTLLFLCFRFFIIFCFHNTFLIKHFMWVVIEIKKDQQMFNWTNSIINKRYDILLI